MASMRPRLIAVDDWNYMDLSNECCRASMRPRLIAVDDERWGPTPAQLRYASMRPRLIAVDDNGSGDRVMTSPDGFNEATADRRG